MGEDEQSVPAGRRLQEKQVDASVICCNSGTRTPLQLLVPWTANQDVPLAGAEQSPLCLSPNSTMVQWAGASP